MDLSLRGSVTDTHFVNKHLMLNISIAITWSQFFYLVVFGATGYFTFFFIYFFAISDC